MVIIENKESRVTFINVYNSYFYLDYVIDILIYLYF